MVWNLSNWFWQTDTQTSNDCWCGWDRVTCHMATLLLFGVWGTNWCLLMQVFVSFLDFKHVAVVFTTQQGKNSYNVYGCGGSALEYFLYTTTWITSYPSPNLIFDVISHSFLLANVSQCFKNYFKNSVCSEQHLIEQALHTTVSIKLYMLLHRCF